MFTLKGVYNPIATPFTDDEIDYGKLDDNLAFWLSSKLEGLVVLGSNGEFVSLREAEKEALIRHCCKRAQGRKRLIVGVGSNSITETLHLCRLSHECGADAVLAVTPFYYKNAMSDSVLSRYFTEVADRSPLPVVLYNMPANTGVNTSSALVSALSRHENIIGIKDTSGNIVQIAETVRDAAPDFTVFAGNWGFFLPSLHMGVRGATMALANILPDECVLLMELFAQGKFDEARALAWRLMPINAAVTTRYGIGGLKVAMDCIGLHGGDPRSPLRRPDAETCAIIRETLVRADVIPC